MKNTVILIIKQLKNNTGTIKHQVVFLKIAIKSFEKL